MDELTDYQKGMAEAICGIIELIIAKSDEPLRKIIFEHIDELKDSLL